MPPQSHDSAPQARRRRGLSRRTLFAAAGATGAAGLAAARPSAAVTSPKRSKTGAGYRETEHVRTVYRLARF